MIVGFLMVIVSLSHISLVKRPNGVFKINNVSEFGVLYVNISLSLFSKGTVLLVPPALTLVNIKTLISKLNPNLLILNNLDCKDNTF
jgi:hypothetical protein